MTPSEKYVAELCEKSFLPFWSFPNPIGKKNKELCDVIVICENTIIIISVKDITVSENNDEVINYERWVKKAIENSVIQIYGAERFLKTTDYILLNDRKTKIKLPPKNSRIIHRIAIAFGSKEEYPLPIGDYGKGFVNVFDEKSTSIILSELDTITDFTNYLKAKETFIENKYILIPREVDFLAFYLQTGLELEHTPNVILLEEYLWENYTKSKEYEDWKNDILGSYIWDIMIWELFKNHITSETTLERRNEIEEAVRHINLEPRINRIVLGEILSKAIKEKVNARMLRPLENQNHLYVFMPLTNENWDEKEGELLLRCNVARLENPTTHKVIGIAIGNNDKGQSCFDICFINIPELDEDFIKHAEKVKNELGYFKNPKITNNN